MPVGGLELPVGGLELPVGGLDLPVGGLDLPVGGLPGLCRWEGPVGGLSRTLHSQVECLDASERYRRDIYSHGG